MDKLDLIAAKFKMLDDSDKDEPIELDDIGVKVETESVKSGQQNSYADIFRKVKQDKEKSVEKRD